MRTKLMIAAILAAMCSLPLSAQVKIGIEAGANLSKFAGSGTHPSAKGDTKMKAGYQLGITADYEFKNHLMLMSGLSFIQRSGDLNQDLNYVSGTGKAYLQAGTRINYLQVPLRLGYNFHISENFSLIPSVGIYAAYGLGAGSNDICIKGKTDAKPSDYPSSWKPLQGKSEYGLGAFRRWDWGGIAGVKAVIAKHYTVSVDYSLGVMKAQPVYGLRNSTLKMSVGYRF